MVRILAADDDPDILLLVETKIRQLGYEVVTVPDGEAALLALGSSDFDLAVLDVNMPGRSGLEVVAEVRAGTRAPRIPIMLMSALSSREALDRGFSAGADDYVTKPFNLRDLADRVQRLVDAPVSDPATAAVSPPTPARRARRATAA